MYTSIQTLEGEMKNTTKAILTTLFFSILIGTTAEAKLPATWAEFKQEYQIEAKTPQGALNMLFKGIFCYNKAVQTKNNQLKIDAGKMIRYAIYSETPIESSPNYSTFRERLNNPDYHYIFRSYCQGTSVDNSYQMDPENFKLDFGKYVNEGEKAGRKYCQLFIKSSGADKPRFVRQTRELDGLWYTTKPQNVYLDVRKPKSYVIKNMNKHDPDYD